MESIGPAVFWTVQALGVLLFLLGVGAFRVLVQGCFTLRRRARAGSPDYSDVLLKSALVPAVTTIAVPPDALPESRQFARRLLDLHFGRNEVVIVLDGPSEAEMATWCSEFKLYQSARPVERKLPTAPVRGVYESRDPIRIVVVDKEPGGMADAWNAGVNVATSPVIGLLDPEGEFSPTVLLRMIQPMLEAFEETVAVCGGDSIPAAADLTSRWGALESLRAWMTRGAAFASRNLVLPIPGSAVLARRDSIIASGGFTGGALELIVRLHGHALASQKPYRIAFLPAPVSYGRTPRCMAELRHMVRRDQRELALAFHHRKSLAGPFGWRIMRELYLDRSVRPKLETAAYLLAAAGLVMGWVDWKLAAFVLLSTAAMGMVQSLGAVVLREVAQPARSDPAQIASLFLAAIPENLGYRQLRNLWLIADSSGSAGAAKLNRGRMVENHPPPASATPTKE
ncbi:MAG: glycosyltransferase [Bryobacteraceae bacterium]|jgi:cellulose synthase/poly-beta-1,6-N-acetylglucosamine synthase-like glycosyltransferase